MKNNTKSFGIIALMAIIIFSIIACDDGNKTPTYDSVTINIPSESSQTLEEKTYFRSVWYI